MRFNLFFNGELETKNANVGQLLEWLSALRFDLPDDVFVDISIKEGEQL